MFFKKKKGNGVPNDSFDYEFDDDDDDIPAFSFPEA